PDLIGLRRFDPDFAHHYRRLREFPEVPDRPTPDLPARVHVSELPTSDGRRIPIGVGGGAHEPVYVDFDADPHLLIAGPPSSGRANTVRLLIDGITARDGGAEPRVHVFDAHQILRSEEHTSELQSRENLVCRLPLEKKNTTFPSRTV